jgi:dienelactone hydrolase
LGDPCCLAKESLMKSLRQFIPLVAVIAATLLVLPRIAWAQGDLDPSCRRAQESTKFEKVEYKSGGLTITGYLYTPAAEGRFPVVIYNHGDRDIPRRCIPFEYIGEMLSKNGYVVLVPERRGYGKSEGKTIREEIGAIEEKIGEREALDRNDGKRLVERLKDEATDVLSAIPFLQKRSKVDMNRISLMGWSYGGIVTLFAASQMRFHAAIAQAPAAQTWDLSAELQMALKEAASYTTTPVFISVAENDRTTAVVRELDNVLNAQSFKRIYQKFAPRCFPPAQDAPGHAIFRPEGMPIWKKDVLRFLSDLSIGPWMFVDTSKRPCP